MTGEFRSARIRAPAQGGTGLNGEHCPYREHAAITVKEHHAWEVLMAAFGQLRLAPSARVVEIGMTAAFGIARAQGFDGSVISELLKAAEGKLIEALNVGRSWEPPVRLELYEGRAE